jgi:hypothetical protein
MESENRQLAHVPNAVYLAGTGVAVLLTKNLLLDHPLPRLLLAGGAVVWGVYLLGKNQTNKTPGWTSIAVGGALALFGGLMATLSGIAGVGLIIGGVVSFVSGLFRKNDTL